jgi:hypothetical protein
MPSSTTIKFKKKSTFLNSPQGLAWFKGNFFLIEEVIVPPPQLKGFPT